jgi:hypothetical protein
MYGERGDGEGRGGNGESWAINCFTSLTFNRRRNKNCGGDN